MIRFLLARVAAMIPTFVAVIAGAFFLMRIAPGGPFDMGVPMPEEVRARFEVAYGLDRPLWVQFGHYLAGLARGDLGPSFRSQEFTVSELIGAGLSTSVQLALYAIGLALAIGLPAGLLAARGRASIGDRGVLLFSTLAIAIPTFVLAPLLSLLLGIYLGWLPISGWRPLDPRYVLLPSISLALPFAAYIARLVRARAIEVLGTAYIRTAIAKGLSMRTIMLRHALRPILLPVASFLGPAMAGVVVGSVVIERVFAIPGIGRYFVEGALSRDYTLVMGVIVVYAALLLVLTFIVDVVYALLDPRIRLQ